MGKLENYFNPSYTKKMVTNCFLYIYIWNYLQLMRNILKNTRPEKYFPRASPLSLSHYTPVTLINLWMILQNIYNNLNILLFDNLHDEFENERFEMRSTYIPPQQLNNNFSHRLSPLVIPFHVLLGIIEYHLQTITIKKVETFTFISSDFLLLLWQVISIRRHCGCNKMTSNNLRHYLHIEYA